MKLALAILAAALFLLPGPAVSMVPVAVEEGRGEIPEAGETRGTENDDSRFPFKLGLGYQAMVVDEFINGASIRGWFQHRIGVQFSVHHHKRRFKLDYVPDFKTDAYFFAGKLLYAPVLNQNSKFYVGIEGGYGYEDVRFSDNINYWALSPLFGAEYHFSGLPEIGFNFEVGYRFLNLTQGGHYEYKIDINDIWAGFGATYYF